MKQLTKLIWPGFISLDRIGRAPKKLVDRLQPPAAGGSYFPELDGLRALAILLVISHHAWWVAGSPKIIVSIGGATLNLTPVFASGFIGVNLFFVLSGFLLSFPFLRAYYQQQAFPSVRKYYARRFLRIIPGFYAAVLLQVALGTPRWFMGGANAWQTLPAHLTFLFNFSPEAQSAINGVFWTLSIEMQFYLVLPVMMYLVFKRQAWLTVLGVLAIGFGWRYVAFQNFPTNLSDLIFNSDHQLPYQLLQFGVGILACAIYLWIHLRLQWVERRPRRMLVVGMGLSLIGAGIVIWASNRIVSIPFWVGKLDYYLLPLGLALGFGCLLLGAVYAPVFIRRIWRNSLARLIGVVSYGMYLWHFPLLYWISTWPWVAAQIPPRQLQILLIVGSAAATLIGLISLVVIERPFIRMGARNQRATPPVLAASSVPEA